MAGFKFRLQSYLSVKEKIEDQKKLEYGKALNKLEEEREIKRQLVNKKMVLIETFKNRVSKNFVLNSVQNYNDYIDYLKKKIRDQDILIDIAEKEAENKRQELVEAMKQRKMLDILKENDNIEYLKEQQKAEQKIVDEIVSYQYNGKG